MNYIKGKYKSIIFQTESGYKVGLFRVHETDIEELNINRTITFTGYFTELNEYDNYVFYGEYIFHNRYGYQFNVVSYEKIMPTGEDAIIDFLTSSFVKGCGEKTAQKIYELFGDNTLNKIKESPSNLLLVNGMNDKKANSIYNSVMKYFEADKEIISLKKMGFTMKEIMNLLNTYNSSILDIIKQNIYQLVDLIDFNKLDSIFLTNNDSNDSKRIKACIIETLKKLTFINGDIYLNKIEILEYMASCYQINESIDDYLMELSKDKKIMIINDDYYLIDDYLDELNNAKSIASLLNKMPKKIANFGILVEKTESELNIKYNDEQISAIKTALSNNISIITGGPGTGKTTIIQGIIKIYSAINKLNVKGIIENILLLAPTGRASKRMSETTLIGASTIHRFLKWDKENNTFGINENNKLHYNLIIIDETSMIDNHLLSSLFKGISLDTQIIFVGDEYQLPSVGPGLILSDMISSGIPHISLEYIYRQSDNSYIPVLAKEIKTADLEQNYLEKKDDYNFIISSNHQIKDVITQILTKYKSKKIDLNKVQILAPMYKGENGIDNLNILLQSIYNNSSDKKKEITSGSVIYREGDKILNTVNDVEMNIYNGDIGYISTINPDNKIEYLTVNYDGNIVTYKKDMLSTITHAYAISIHKSQGSEFDHVIMPITLGYSRMLYNKLLYTGISRAKKSLILIGSEEAFVKSVNNNYSVIRKTTLKQKIIQNIHN